MPIAKLVDLRELRVIHVAILSMVLFVGVAALIPQRELMRFLNIYTLSVAIAVVVTFAPIWLNTLAKRVNDVGGGEMLSLGIGCTWTSEIGQRIWSLVWRGFAQPEWMTTNYSLPFLLWLCVLGGVQHLTSPGAVDGIVPARNWIVLGAAIGTATLVTLLWFWWSGGATF